MSWSSKAGRVIPAIGLYRSNSSTTGRSWNPRIQSNWQTYTPVPVSRPFALCMSRILFGYGFPSGSFSIFTYSGLYGSSTTVASKSKFRTVFYGQNAGPVAGLDSKRLSIPRHYHDRYFQFQIQGAKRCGIFLPVRNSFLLVTSHFHQLRVINHCQFHSVFVSFFPNYRNNVFRFLPGLTDLIGSSFTCSHAPLYRFISA